MSAPSMQICGEHDEVIAVLEDAQIVLEGICSVNEIARISGKTDIRGDVAFVASAAGVAARRIAEILGPISEADTASE